MYLNFVENCHKLKEIIASEIKVFVFKRAGCLFE